jgi:predicted metal-dependent hydrolase
MTESFQQSEPTEPAELRIIPIRNFDFEFPQDLDPVWVPQNPYRSHFFNGVSLTMPRMR